MATTTTTLWWWSSPNSSRPAYHAQRGGEHGAAEPVTLAEDRRARGEGDAGDRGSPQEMEHRRTVHRGGRCRRLRRSSQRNWRACPPPGRGCREPSRIRSPDLHGPQVAGLRRPAGTPERTALDAVAEYRAGESRGDLRRQAWMLIGTIAEPAASVRERSDGDSVIFEVATRIPDGGHFASHGHAVPAHAPPGERPLASVGPGSSHLQDERDRPVVDQADPLHHRSHPGPPSPDGHIAGRQASVSGGYGRFHCWLACAGTVPDLQLHPGCCRPVRIVEAFARLRVIKRSVGLRDEDLRAGVVAVVQVHRGPVGGAAAVDVHALARGRAACCPPGRTVHCWAPVAVAGVALDRGEVGRVRAAHVRRTARRNR